MKKSMIFVAALCITMAANAFEKEMTMPTMTFSNETCFEGETRDKTPITKAEAQELTKKLKHLLSEKEKALLTYQTYQEFTEEEDCGCNNMERLQIEWEEKFINFLSENPKTLDLSEKELENLLGESFEVVTSPDGRLRVYSWYTDRGGTWINYCSVMQYRTDDGNTYVTWEYDLTDEEDLDDEEGMDDEEEMAEEYEDYDEEDDGIDCGWEWSSMVTKIHQMDTADGRIYLIQDYDIYSGLSGDQSIEAIAITDDTLTLMPIFMVDGKKKSYMSFETNRKDATDDSFLTFDKKSQTIIGHQYESDEYLYEEDTTLSRKDIVYKYDGMMFSER